MHDSCAAVACLYADVISAPQTVGLQVLRVWFSQRAPFQGVLTITLFLCCSPGSGGGLRELGAERADV